MFRKVYLEKLNLDRKTVQDDKVIFSAIFGAIWIHDRQVLLMGLGETGEEERERKG